MDDTKLEQFIYETLRRGIHFAHRDVSPATPLYIALEDRLRVLIFNSVAAAEVDIELRLQLPDGQVIPWRGQFFPTSNRASNSFEQDLAEGFLLDVSVSTPTAALRAGACYVVLQIIRGTGANAIVMRSLLANYVTTGMAVGWPEGPSQSSAQGNGAIRSVQVSNPAAGAEFTVTVPTGARWSLQSISFLFTTSAAVANRIPRIIIDDGANIVVQTGASLTQTASQVIQWTGMQGTQFSTVQTGNNTFFCLPEGTLLQGWRIRSSTLNFDAADTYTNIWLNVQEWIEQ